MGQYVEETGEGGEPVEDGDEPVDLMGLEVDDDGEVVNCEKVEEEKQNEEEATIVLPAAVEQFNRNRMGRVIKAHRWRGD